MPGIGIRGRPALRRAATALGRLHACEGGQAMFVVVLFFFLLAGLLFLVINSGEKLNHKVQMQNAADSAATTGAAWYARGLNVLSMCNVAETQLLSLIVLLDTLESVVPPAQECIDDLMKRIGSSRAGHDIPVDSRISDWLAVGNAASEREIIRRFGDIVRAVNWPEYLTYDTGVLWECAKLMDGFSHSMLKVTPLAAQREAIDIADKNGAAFGFVVPLWPELPVVDGQFKDFENPMRKGCMPPPPDDQIIGGFDRVLGYHGYAPDYYWNNDLQHGWGPVMGPWSYWREPFAATQPMGLLDISRFSILFNIVSARKLEMMFGQADDRVSLKNWEMDYDRAKGLGENQIRNLWWDYVSFDARYEFPKSSFFSNIDLRHAHKPLCMTYARENWNSSPDLRQFTRSRQSYEGADPRLAVFYRVRKDRTAHYPQLGIFAPHPPLHPDGSAWDYTDAEKKDYYHVYLWRFNGAELEDDTSLHRNYLPPAGGAPLAPILFDLATREHLTATVNEHFTFNGFAYRPGAVRQWGKRFVNPNPTDELIAYAQARVFNRYSWDLFTQDWKVKLMRADRWQVLTGALGRSVPDQDLAAKLTKERLDPVRQMLEAYSDPFVEEVSH